MDLIVEIFLSKAEAYNGGHCVAGGGWRITAYLFFRLAILA
jgi:hypothetical protein